MSKPTLFFANLCPDTQSFVAQLKKLHIDYDEVEIMSSITNLKQFLQLRDRHSAFKQAKTNSSIGIPALLIDEQVVLDIHQLQDLDKS